MKKIWFIFLGSILLSCSDMQFNPSSDSSGSNISKGGSTARFAIRNSFLYVVDDKELKVFDISDANSSELVFKDFVGFGIETIYPYGDMLFLGTQTGVLIFDISRPKQPVQIGSYSHILSCDPVVTDGAYAYITLRTGSNCGRPVNELHILDLSNINNPDLIAVFQLVNPRGLAIHQNTLFVCDDGVKVFDVSNKLNIKLTNHLKNIPANDVIFHRDQLLVTATNGFYQFDASDFEQLSYYKFYK